MTIDNTFMIKRIGRYENIFVLFSNATKMPFLECDDNTFNDQVFVFSDEERAKDAARSYYNNEYETSVARVPKGAVPQFLTSLYNLGANTVVVQDEGAPVEVELEKLREKPDIEALRNDKIPRANPELVLCGCYFLQELRRRGERTDEERRRLRELEEEMVHYLVKSRFIVSFDTTAIKGKWDPRDREHPAKIPLIKRSDGAVFQPLYSDFGEFQRFNSQQKTQGVRMNLIAAPYEKLPGFLHRDSKGFVLNPGGFNLVLAREQLEKLAKTYGQ